MTNNSIDNLTPAELNIVKQTLEVYRQTLQASSAAPRGEKLNCIEDCLLQNGRELLAKMAQEAINEETAKAENDEENRRCPHCHQKMRHRGSKKKTLISALGDILFKRNTYECVHCHCRVFIADEAVIGNISKLTKGARKLITLAGASWGFRNAADKLKTFTGLNISYNTLKQYTYCEAKNFKKMLTTRSKAQEKFIKASGVTELMTDGTMVNTTNGWKEIRLIQASKRQLGDYANADTFSTRHLPKPTVVYCIGCLENAKRFASRWSGFAKILHIHNFSELHFISDGAGWIWKACQKYFPNCQGCLDYYHGCEHISQCAEELFKDKVQKQEFYESCRMAMLREGWEGIKGVIDQYRQQISVYKWKNYLSKLYNYFEKRQNELTYRSRLANGYAIGSGEIEGACKQLVGRRLKQTGARWKIGNLNRMLSIVCAAHNDAWDLYWSNC